MSPPAVSSTRTRSSSTSSSMPDMEAMCAQQRRKEVRRQVMGASDAAVVDSGVFNPAGLIRLIAQMAPMASEEFKSVRTTAAEPCTPDFVDKLHSFEERFLDAAVEAANKKGMPLSQAVLSLIAHDLLRDLAESASKLRVRSASDGALMNSYAALFEALGKFHLAYNVNDHFFESATRTVEGAKLRNPHIDKPWTGVRSSSEKSLGLKAGVDVGVSLACSAGIVTNRDLVRDDDDDTLLLKTKSGEIGLGGGFKTSTVLGSLKASLTGKLKYGKGSFVDGTDVHTVSRVESAHKSNHYHFPGHRSSRPAVRSVVKAGRQARQFFGNVFQGNAFRPDVEHPHFFDDRKIFDYANAQPMLHTLIDSVLSKSRSHRAGGVASAFKAAYPLVRHDVTNAMPLSTVGGVTRNGSSQEKFGSLTSSTQSFSADAGLKSALSFVPSAGVGSSIKRKVKELEFERMVDSHEAISPMNAGSLGRASSLIESARAALTSASSEHLFCLVDRVVDDRLLKGTEPLRLFDALDECVATLDAEHARFLALHEQFRRNPKNPGSLKEINRLYFDNHFDIDKNFKKKDFVMDFLAKSHDAFSVTLGIIGNRAAQVRGHALAEIRSGRCSEARIALLDERAQHFDDAYIASSGKLASPASAIPKERRLRNTLFRLASRLKQKSVSAESSVKVSLTLPGLPLGGAAGHVTVADFMDYVEPAVEFRLGIERSRVREHVNPFRLGAYLTLSCDFGASVPLAEFILQRGDALVEKIVKEVGNRQAMSPVERENIRAEIRRQLRGMNLSQLPVKLVGGAASRRIVFKMRKPIRAKKMKSAKEFKGVWKTQYLHVDAGHAISTGYSTPNLTQIVGLPGNLALKLSSNQSVSAPLKEAIGNDVGYHALQFTDGNAWDDQTQTIDIERLRAFYRHGQIHANKELYKDGKYVAMHVFANPEQVLDIVSEYLDYKEGKSEGSDYALFDTPEIREAARAYLHGTQIAPGQVNGKKLSELAATDPNPYAIIKLPTRAELSVLKDSLASGKSKQTFDIYLDTEEGRKVLTAYFQLMKALNIDKAAYRQNFGFEPGLRPYAIGKQS